MDIAYIYDVAYPWVKGGVEKRVYEIAKRLVREGHDVHLFSLKWWKGHEDIVLDGIYLHGIGEWNGKLYVGGRRSITEGLYFGWKVLTKLRGRFDIIDCQQSPYFSCISSKVHSIYKRVPLIITWHEVWDKYWLEYLGKKGVFGWVVERFTTRLANENIAVSEKTRRDLEKLGVKAEVIPNGIDFEKILKIKRSDIRSDIIFVGRLIKEKRVDILIRAVKVVKEEYPDIRCVIVGDGPERAKLEKLVRDLNLERNVKFTGFINDYDEVIALMKASKVFVFPSIREGFGIVALEANACGLPVITVDHKMNATKDLINNGSNGFICNLSERDLAEKTLMAMSKVRMLRNKCIENAKKYDWNIITTKIQKFYEGVL